MRLCVIVKRGKSTYSVLVENIEKRLGAVVKSLRQAAGMTQERLAEQLTAAGLPTRQNTVAKLEGGLRPTTVIEFGALARIFNYSVPELAQAVFSDDAIVDEAAREAMVSELTELRSRIDDARRRMEMHMAMVAEAQYQLREFETRAALLESSLDGRNQHKNQD